MEITDDRRVLLEGLLKGASTPALTPDDAGADLLARLLWPRVKPVYLDAARPWPDDTEALVHDVRVATRRLVEALALASPLLWPSDVRRAQRRAKALRRALGAARESDVLVADFRALAEGAGLDQETVHALDAMAAHGSRALEEAAAEYPPERLLRHAVDVMALAQRPRRALTLRQVAGVHLYDRSERARPRVASLADPAASEAHHQLRIDFKHLRYTTEILGDPFTDEMDGKRLVKAMKEVQDALGVLNDADDLVEWLGRRFLKKTLGAERAARVRELARAQKAERYERARDAVLGVAPALLAETRRIAGHIGHLELP